MITFHLLLSLTVQGMLWTLLLLALCFGGVYVAELCKLGWAYREQASEQQKQAPADKPQEPVYYLVEKPEPHQKSGHFRRK